MLNLAKTFGALSDVTRLQMLSLVMKHGELCVCDFVATLGISQSKASRHLRYLLHAGLLTDRRDGLWVYYRLSPKPGAGSRIVVSALKRIFTSYDTSDLDGRLKKWLARKERRCPVPARPAATPQTSRTPLRSRNSAK